MKAIVLTPRGLNLALLGCYGNDWVATPHLDRLASAGTVFDCHLADCPEAEAAARTWRSGSFAWVRPPASADLLCTLAERHVHTALVTDRPASGAFGADWDRAWTVTRAPEAGKHGYGPLRKAAGQALEWCAQSGDALLWIDTDGLLPPWRVPQELADLYADQGAPAQGEAGKVAGQELNDDEGAPILDPGDKFIDWEDEAVVARVQNGYATAVTCLDDFVGWLMKETAQRGLADECLVLVSTDCGQPLGERGGPPGTEPSLHEPQVHLPLVIRLPGGVGAGRRVSGLTQPPDLMPTLLSAFGAAPAGVQGQSLWSLCQGEAGARRPYAVSAWPADVPNEWSLRSAEWALILGQRRGTPSPRTPLPQRGEERNQIPSLQPLSPKAERGTPDSQALLWESDAEAEAEVEAELYEKPADRWEVNNVAAHHADLVADMAQALRRFVDAARAGGTFEYPEWKQPGAAATSEAIPSSS